MDRDVSRISKLSKTRYDSLTDLTKRIQVMRSSLHHFQEKTVEQELVELNMQSNKGNTDNYYTQCTHCQRKILKALYDGHIKTCQFLFENGAINKPDIYDINQTITTKLATFKPQPPRNLYIKSKGVAHICLGWDPPVIDGGLQVTDYEISFVINCMDMNKKTGKYEIYTIRPEPITTSHWCFINPIFHNGYKITNIRAGAEYTSFKVRCKNLRGWSEYCYIDPINNNITLTNRLLANNSNEADDIAQNRVIISPTAVSVKTSEPDPPSPPLYITCSQITSTCMHLHWQEPMYDGGLEIIHYIIHYTIVERHISATSRNILIDKPLKYTVGNVTR